MEEYKILGTPEEVLFHFVHSAEQGEPTPEGEETFRMVEKLLKGKTITEVHQIQDEGSYPDGRGFRFILENGMSIDFQAYYGSGFGTFSIVTDPPQKQKAYCWSCENVMKTTIRISTCTKCGSDWVRYAPRR